MASARRPAVTWTERPSADGIEIVLESLDLEVKEREEMERYLSKLSGAPDPAPPDDEPYPVLRNDQRVALEHVRRVAYRKWVRRMIGITGAATILGFLVAGLLGGFIALCMLMLPLLLVPLYIANSQVLPVPQKPLAFVLALGPRGFTLRMPDGAERTHVDLAKLDSFAGARRLEAIDANGARLVLPCSGLDPIDNGALADRLNEALKELRSRAGGYR